MIFKMYNVFAYFRHEHPVYGTDCDLNIQTSQTSVVRCCCCSMLLFVSGSEKKEHTLLLRKTTDWCSCVLVFDVGLCRLSTLDRASSLITCWEEWTRNNYKSANVSTYPVRSHEYFFAMQSTRFCVDGAVAIIINTQTRERQIHTYSNNNLNRLCNMSVSFA